MGEERRREPRAPLMLRVEYDAPGELVVDYTENISRGGTFVYTERELAIGEPLQIILSFPGLLEPLRLKGTVRWIRSEPFEQRGAGIQFDALTDGDRVRLEDLIARIAQQDPALVVRNLRVLVVEDNPHVAALIRDGLTSRSKRDFGGRVTFEFTLVENGRAALDVIRDQTFDVMIVDIYLPVLDGAHVIREVKANPQTAAVPVLAVSAGGPAARADALRAGADFYLDKPMKLAEVMATVRRLMNA